MDVSIIELQPTIQEKDTRKSKQRGRQRETTSAIFPIDMMPIDGCFEDVVQQWPLFFVVDCRLTSDSSH